MESPQVVEKDEREEIIMQVAKIQGGRKTNISRR